MRADLLDVQKVGESWFAFRFDFRKVHGIRKVVDKAAVNVKDIGFAKGTHEHISNLLVTVPVSDAVGEGNSKEGVALEDIWYAVEEIRHLRAVQDRWIALL